MIRWLFLILNSILVATVIFYVKVNVDSIEQVKDDRAVEVKATNALIVQSAYQSYLAVSKQIQCHKQSHL